MMPPMFATVLLISVIVATEAFTRTPDDQLRPLPLRRRKYAAGPLPDTENQRAKRVPDVLEPLDYYIRIQPYFPADNITMPAGKANMTFDGVTTFIFRVKNTTSSFILHSMEMKYSDIKLMDEDGATIDQTFSENPDMEQITIVPTVAPVVGKTYVLQFTYIGNINIYTGGGLYYTSYTDVAGNTHWMLATQMEAFLARHVFPCMDEPLYKAIFHLTLIYPTGYIALANTMERTPVPVDYAPGTPLYGWSVIQYPPSLRMSTYLVAFAIGPFVHQERMTNDGIMIRVWGWTGQEDHLAFAADTSVRCLTAMAQFTNFTFPMPKSDQLGLPEFVAGAMENYGLIIYKYQFVAFNPAVHTTYMKEAAARVICHELGHQWFGDTVSDKWWDDLFLQEGMAAFFEDYAPELGFPEQRDFFDAKFLVESEQAGLISDAVVNDSHSIYYWDGPAFDDITYLKGSSVLRMIEHTLGTEIFREALQDYIHDYKFSNADHDMFFGKLTKAAQNHGLLDWCDQPFDAARWLEPWFLQQSFPLVTVTNNDPMSPPVLAQEPFNDISLLPQNTTQSTGKYNYTWPIPVFGKNYMNSTKVFKWLVPDYAKTHCPPPAVKPHSKALHWEMDNAESRAFMRTQYDDIGYARLLKRLTKSPSDFTTADRIVLIGDQIALMNRQRDAGKPFTFSKVLDMIDAIVPSYPHFGTTELAQTYFLDAMEKMFLDSSDYGLVQLFMKKLFEENYKTLAWNITGDWDKDVTRYLTLPYAVRYNLGDSVQKAQALFKQFLIDCKDAKQEITGCTKIHPDLRLSVYCGGIMAGDDADFDALVKFYQQEYIYDFYYYQEFYAMLGGLACTRSQANTKKLIPMILNTYRLPQNKYNLASLPLYFLTKNPKTSVYMAEYLLQNASSVFDSGNLEEYLSAMTSTWYSPGHAARFANIYQQLNSTLTADQKQLFDKYYAVALKQANIGDSYLHEILRFMFDSDNVLTKNLENWVKQIPPNLKPYSYDLTVQPFVPGSASYPWYKNLTLEGTITIKGTGLHTTNEVVLNAHRIIIHPEDVTFVLDANPEKACTLQELVKDYDNGMLTLRFSDCWVLVDQNFTLTIKYRGFVFGEPKKGVYTNTNYYEFNDQKAWIFATYFESGPSARSLAPCFDEPRYKASWKVTLLHPADTIALGNMPDQGMVIGQNGWATTTFAPTPPMSSYLLSLAAGHFASLQTVSKTGALIRMWAWTGMERYAEHSLKSVTGMVDFMSDYFNYSYPLPKLDVLALPQYTSLRGAEEHWGLIHVIYDRELADPLYTVASTYMDVASVTAHETVHQWFGDLVTIAHWNEVFLNEGFANYWETNGVMNAFPEQTSFERYERFRKATVAMSVDSNPASAKPVIADTPSYFTTETYHKGATMLHMLSNAIQPENLQKGLQLYIKENAFGNVEEGTLWSAINRAINNTVIGWNGNSLDVSQLMTPWMHQATYPVLRVTKAGQNFNYSQEPFITDKTIIGESVYDYKWIIPIYTQDSQGKEVFHYFVGTNGTDAFWNRPVGNGWSVENAGFKTFMNVWYDNDSWDPIYKALVQNRQTFDEITRAQFINDAFYLLMRGSMNWKRILELGLLLNKEDSYAPFYAFKTTLDALLARFKNTEYETRIKNYANAIIEPVYDKIGWSHTGDWTHDALASLVTEYACSIGNPKCLTKANETFTQFITSCQYSLSGTGACNSIAPDLRRTQYCYGLQQNPQYSGIVESLYKWFVGNSRYFSRDMDNLLYAMSCVQTQDAANTVLDNIFNGIYPSVAFSYVAQNAKNTEMITYFKNHQQCVYAAAEFSDFISSAAKTYNTAAQLTELQSISNMLTAADDRTALNDAVNTVQAHLDWLTANTGTEAGIIPFLDNHHFAAF